MHEGIALGNWELGPRLGAGGGLGAGGWGRRAGAWGRGWRLGPGLGRHVCWGWGRCECQGGGVSARCAADIGAVEHEEARLPGTLARQLDSERAAREARLSPRQHRVPARHRRRACLVGLRAATPVHRHCTAGAAGKRHATNFLASNSLLLGNHCHL